MAINGPRFYEKWKKSLQWHKKNVYRPEKGNLLIVSPWSRHSTHIPLVLQRFQEETGTSSSLKKDWPTTAGLHPGSWINRLSVSREKFHGTIYVEKARVLRSNLTMFRPCSVRKYYEWFWEVLSLPRKLFIMWFTESVDRQISGMCGWARVTRILGAKHKNVSV